MSLYGIDNYIIEEGYGIEKWGEIFVWYYIERGNKENLKYFQTEMEIVEFAFDIISNDKFAKSHFLTSFDDFTLINELKEDLSNRKINFWTDEIPYLGRNNKLTRFFIVGCDIQKIKDIKLKFNVNL